MAFYLLSSVVSPVLHQIRALFNFKHDSEFWGWVMQKLWFGQ